MVSADVLQRLIGAVSVLATSPRPLQERLQSACDTHLVGIPAGQLPERFASQLEVIVQHLRSVKETGEEVPQQTASALAERILILCVEALRSP